METFCARLGWIVLTWTMLAIPLLCGLSWTLHWHDLIIVSLTALTAFEFLIAMVISIVVIKDKE